LFVRGPLSDPRSSLYETDGAAPGSAGAAASLPATPQGETPCTPFGGYPTPLGARGQKPVPEGPQGPAARG